MRKQRRIHLSETKIATVKDATQATNEPRNKPSGFWYAINDAWGKYVDEEENSLDRPYRFAYEITLHSKRLLHLSSAKKTRAFEAEFGRMLIANLHFKDKIDWKLVAERFDGFEAVPYFFDEPIDDIGYWYETLSVPGGCIWNTAAIKSIREIPIVSVYGPKRQPAVQRRRR